MSNIGDSKDVIMAYLGRIVCKIKGHDLLVVGNKDQMPKGYCCRCGSTIDPTIYAEMESGNNGGNK